MTLDVEVVKKVVTKFAHIEYPVTISGMINGKFIIGNCKNSHCGAFLEALGYDPLKDFVRIHWHDA